MPNAPIKHSVFHALRRTTNIALSIVILQLFANLGQAQLPLRAQFVGPSSLAPFAESVAILDDLDGDGCAEFAIGSGQDTGFGVHFGRVEIRSGSEGSLLRSIGGTSPQDNFGRYLVSLDDLDGDGLRELGIGRPDFGGVGVLAGAIDVYSPGTQTTLFTLPGPQSLNFYGEVFRSVGDVDGDGIDEILVGIPRHRVGTIEQGAAFLYSGASGNLLRLHTGLQISGEFGAAVLGVGDLDGDGTRDYAVGAPGEGASLIPSGRVHLFSGQLGTSLMSLDGSSPDERFGANLAVMASVDGDSEAELVVAAPRHGGVAPFETGRLAVFGGSSLVFYADLLGTSPGERLGSRLGNSADFNGDGVSELMAATWSEAELAPGVPAAAPGAVVLFSGFFEVARFVGSAVGDGFGDALAVHEGSDIDGDGIDDALVLASQSAPGNAARGVVQLLSFAGARHYGRSIGDPTQTLSISWIPGSPPDLRRGSLGIRGAAPGAAGLVGVGLLPARTNQSGLTVLIDLSLPDHLLLPINYAANGQRWFDADLSDPRLSGTSLYLQGLATEPSLPNGLAISPGLELRFPAY